MKVNVDKKEVVVKRPPNTYDFHITGMSEEQACTLRYLFGMCISGSPDTKSRSVTNAIWDALCNGGVPESSRKAFSGELKAL